MELVPLGRGHTDNDLVVHVRDANTWIVGDVVEATVPPMFGSGCFPLDLPMTLGGLLEEIGSADVIIPGHGPPVGREFVVNHVADARDGGCGFAPCTPPGRRSNSVSSRKTDGRSRSKASNSP